MQNLNKIDFCIQQKTFIYFIILSIFSFFYVFVSTDTYAKVFDNKNNVSGSYNVILILLDSIRADHLGCYGYQRSTSPTIDKLASEGILFEQAIAQSTWSLPSQCSILTSKYVPSHGVDDVRKRLSDSELTLAEILKIYGYKTAAFTGGFWVSSIFNIGQGFDIYYDKLTFGKLKDTVPLAVNWLERNKGNKFFLLLQGFDGHSPFSLPKIYEEMYADPKYNGIFKTLRLDHRIGDRLFGYNFFLDYNYKEKVIITNKDIEYIIDQYDGSINYADKYIGEFIKKLDEFNLRGNTLVILTSYHGTPLFEHGIILRRQHGGGTEGAIRIPLIIRRPYLSKRHKKIINQVQQIDIMPTILDFLGIPINHQAQGKSIVPLLENKTGPDFNKYVYSNGYKEIAIRTNKWKLINTLSGNSKVELYNLKKDPAEQNNLINRLPKIANSLKQKLDNWFEETKLNSNEVNSIPKYQIEEIKEEMKRAGYWFLDIPKDKEVIGRQTPIGAIIDKENKN